MVTKQNISKHQMQKIDYWTIYTNYEMIVQYVWLCDVGKSEPWSKQA